MKNYISGFDEKKVKFVKNDMDSETVLYDITDIVKNLVSRTQSIFEYVLKIEMKLYCFYPYKEYDDKMTIIREKFEAVVKEKEFDRFMCVMEDGSPYIANDAKDIYITFKNGSGLVFSNSEWGSVKVLQNMEEK